MKKYFLKILALCLGLILPFAAYFVYIQAKPEAFTGTIMGTAHYKIDLLKETPSPRILLAGGSASPYSTNCEYISENLDMPCINVGVSVANGLDFYLSMLSKYMQKGDIIVLELEHSLLSSRKLEYETIWMSVETDAQVAKVIPLSYWPGLIRGYYSYSRNKLDVLKRHSTQPRNIYNAEFGPLGDVTAQRELILESGYNTNEEVPLTAESLDKDVIKKLNNFYKKAQKKGAQVFFIFAPVNNLAVTSEEHQWQELDSYAREKLHMPILSSLNESIMPYIYFYDSNNHLNSEGAAIYCENLTKELMKYLL